jgi:CTD kinase subunit gamma
LLTGTLLLLPRAPSWADAHSQASLNARINILYFLDSLADTSLATGPPDAPYLPLIERGLARIVAQVVPDTREGLLNLKSARAMLQSWRARRVLDLGLVDAAMAQLDARTFKRDRAGDDDALSLSPSTSKKPKKTADMPKNDILRRIEEDRERHKRLRERIWILPIPPLRAAPSSASAGSAGTSPFTPASPAPSSAPAPAAATKLMPPPPPRAAVVSPLDVEFEQMWESTSELGEDDRESMRE